jgi:peptidyl-prolyl cis-trans isomerase SurA
VENGLLASFQSRDGLPQGRPGTRLRAWLGGFAVALALVGAVVGTRPACAQDELKIAAVINDDVITQLDVVARLRAAMLSARLQDSPETRQQLLPNVMRSLIDDHLKTQEARSQGVTVSDGEINNRIAGLASRNNMSLEEFESYLNSNGILVSALVDQMRADIAWSRLVQRKLRSTIRISDAEINEALARAKAGQGKAEYRLSQIFQAVDAPKDAPAVEQSVQRLLDQLGSGADFASLAQEFSQDTSAAQGGDIGWRRPDQVDPAIAAQLEPLGSGDDVRGKVLGPIQGTGGYYLVQITDVRTGTESVVAPGTVHMVRLLWPLTPNAPQRESKAAMEQADAFSKKEAHSCEEFERLAQDARPAVFQDMGRPQVDQMPPEIRDMVVTQPVGEPTSPILGPGGVAIFVVCDRGDANGQVSRVAIADRLASERLETLARGYLSDLRRAAYIDIRL